MHKKAIACNIYVNDGCDGDGLEASNLLCGTYCISEDLTQKIRTRRFCASRSNSAFKQNPTVHQSRENNSRKVLPVFEPRTLMLASPFLTS